jgi:uncharacterized delta-60 repeat protein
MRNTQLLGRLFLFAYFFLFSFCCFAQVTEEWVARYNNTGDLADIAVDIAVDDDGNVYVTGSSTGAGTFLDYATIKYNAAAVQQWVARYNGPGNFFDEAADLAIDNEGNVYVTGSSEGIGTGTDYATIKYNAAGVQQWIARYNGPGDSTDAAESLAVDENGNLYVTGRSAGSGTGLDYATIKYNTAGVQQWVARYNGPANGIDRGQALVLDNAGNVYVTGHSLGIGTNFDYATIKYNAAGSTLWVARYNGPGNDRDVANAITVDNAGNVYATGTIISGFIPEEPFPLELFDWATIKYNATGVEQWVAIHDEGGDDFAESVLPDNLGNVYVTGSISNSPPRLEEPDLDYGTIKYNASTGAELWVAKYGPPPGADFNEWRADDQAIDSAGNVYVTGQTGQGDYGTVKFNSNGELQWAITYDNGLSDAANAIALDASANVYVTGGSTGSGTGADYATIKYAQRSIACGNKGDDKVLICHKGKKTLCIKSADVSNHLSHGDQLGQCVVNAARVAVDSHQPLITDKNVRAGLRIFSAPNPVYTTTNIYFELPAEGHVTIKVYDMPGREITTLLDAVRKAGYHNTAFNVSALQQGVYFYRITLKTQDKVWMHTGKVSVIK